jgi:phosphonate transport system substrate-binding protein
MALLCGLLLILTLAANACDEADGGDEPLVIAVQPTTTAQELSADAGEIDSFLEDQLGRDVEITFPTSYSGVIEALRFGHADAAFMGAWPAALAVQEANAEIALAEIREVSEGDEIVEKPYYYSYYVVPTDSEYTELAQLEGQTVAYPSQLSTSGYVAPVARLVELGLIEQPAEGEEADPEEFFGEVVFSGGYQQGWEALEAGQVDVTVIAGDVPEDLYNEVLDNTRQIETQGPVPSHSVVYAEDLSEEDRAALTDALLALGEGENVELMRKFVSGIFVRFEETTTEEHLAQLDDYLALTGLRFSEAPTSASACPDPEPEPEAEPEAETPEASPEPDEGTPDANAQPEPDPEPEASTEPCPDGDVTAEPDPEPENETEATAEPDPESEDEATP